MRISDWSSDVCSSDLNAIVALVVGERFQQPLRIFARADDLGVMRVGGAGDDPGTDGVDPLDVRQVERPDGAERVEPRRQVAEARERQAPGEAPIDAVGPSVRVEISTEERRVGTECVVTCRARWTLTI